MYGRGYFFILEFLKFFLREALNHLELFAVLLELHIAALFVLAADPLAELLLEIRQLLYDTVLDGGEVLLDLFIDLLFQLFKQSLLLDLADVLIDILEFLCEFIDKLLNLDELVVLVKFQKAVCAPQLLGLAAPLVNTQVLQPLHFVAQNGTPHHDRINFEDAR